MDGAKTDGLSVEQREQVGRWMEQSGSEGEGMSRAATRGDGKEAADQVAESPLLFTSSSPHHPPSPAPPCPSFPFGKSLFSFSLPVHRRIEGWEQLDGLVVLGSNGSEQ